MAAEHEEIVEEAGWEVVRHIEGSADHQLQGSESWIKYWMTHVKVKAHPCVCPGDLSPGETENKKPHGLSENSKDSGVQTVGCHVILKHKKDNRRAYAIIPACNSCNKGDRKLAEGNLIWYCKAVTILQEDAFDLNFVGKITLRTKSPKQKVKILWWKYVMDIIVENHAKKTLTIRGYTNEDTKPDTPNHACEFVEDKEHKPSLVCKTCNRRQYTYSNPEDYLLKLAAFWRDATANKRGRDLGKWGALLTFQKKFKPRILRCNEEMYPVKPVVYKRAYGLCTHVKPTNCHKDSLKGVELCEEHLSLKYFKRWWDTVLERRKQQAQDSMGGLVLDETIADP